jgi:hypothetical protein
MGLASGLAEAPATVGVPVYCKGRAQERAEHDQSVSLQYSFRIKNYSKHCIHQLSKKFEAPLLRTKFIFHNL